MWLSRVALALKILIKHLDVILSVVIAAVIGVLSVKNTRLKQASKRANQKAIEAKSELMLAKTQAKVVKEVQRRVNEQKDAGTQCVGDADPDTAAQWLHDNANRDDM